MEKHSYYPKTMELIYEQQQDIIDQLKSLAETAELAKIDCETWREIATALYYTEHDEHSHLPSRQETHCERCVAQENFRDQLNHELNP